VSGCGGGRRRLVAVFFAIDVCKSRKNAFLPRSLKILAALQPGSRHTHPMVTTPDAQPPEWISHEIVQRYLVTFPLKSTPLPLVVQFGSEQCALCPQATLDLDALKKSYDFLWHYQDAINSTIAEELDVTGLPALLVFHDTSNYTLYQRLRNTDVTEIIKEHCPPRLVLDEDF